ncbi:MAG: prepilin peptidase [Chloroflexota bacterium]|jgi:leader peptidase (prepilin peptidase)/N-methyltransferase
MEIVYLLLWSLVGLVVGSFLNIAIDRLPRRESLIAPLRCSKCGERKPLYCLSALLAILLRARSSCAGCGTGIDRSGLVVEIATGGAFGLLFFRYGAHPYTFLYSFYTSILIVVFVIDSRHRLILNRVTYPTLLAALLLTPTFTPASPTLTLLGALFGGLIFGLVYAAGYLIYRKAAMALGDVKLATVLGAMVAFPGVVTALLFGTLIGAIVSIAILVARRGSRHEFMPYGPPLCLGAYISFFVVLIGA